MTQYISLRELITIIPLSRSTIYSKIKKEEIPYKRFGRKYIFSLEEIEKIINKKCLKNEK